MFAICVLRESFHDDGEERIEGVEGAIVVLGHLLLLKVSIRISRAPYQAATSLCCDTAPVAAKWRLWNDRLWRQAASHTGLPQTEAGRIFPRPFVLLTQVNTKV